MSLFVLYSIYFPKHNSVAALCVVKFKQSCSTIHCTRGLGVYSFTTSPSRVFDPSIGIIGMWFLLAPDTYCYIQICHTGRHIGRIKTLLTITSATKSAIYIPLSFNRLYFAPSLTLAFVVPSATSQSTLSILNSPVPSPSPTTVLSLKIAA